jgi:lipid II:glycine glycyltransferase (peptidoglycan interpeptide bridge formation enzyme)
VTTWSPATPLPRRASDPSPRRPTEPLTVTVTDEPSPVALAAWSRLVRGSEGGDVAQLPGWARLRATVGFTARYVLVRDQVGRLVGGAQVLERALPLLGRLGYVPYGPVVDGALDDPAPVWRAVCATLDELGRTELRMLFVQPPPGGEAASRELLTRGFRRSEANIAPGQTLRLDLTQELAALRGGLTKRLRTWTNRWEARGVTVRMGTEADLPVLADLVARSGEHQRFAAVTGEYLAALYRELGGGPDGHAVLLVGELHGTPVAATLYTRCADTLTLRFSGMDRDDAVSRVNAPAAVQWHAIRWAKDAGLHWFDFGGISASAADALRSGQPRDTVRGVDRFKAGFGGQPSWAPTPVELVNGRLWRLAFDASRRWRLGRRALELARAALRTGRLPGQRPAREP